MLNTFSRWTAEGNNKVTEVSDIYEGEEGWRRLVLDSDTPYSGPTFLRH
jgi:hypothetical protein